MTVRWGIAGTGRIASDFVRDLANIEDAAAVAVGSRTAAGAAGFAETRGIARAHGSMEELAADPGVDIVYVAGIHPVHRDHAVMMMRAGKHVLVEKPLTVDLGEADKLIEIVKRSGLKLMACFSHRWIPSYWATHERVAAGKIGRPVMAYARKNDRIWVPTKMLGWAAGTTPAWFLSSHDIDLVTWWMGDRATEVYATAVWGVLRGRGIETPDAVQAQVRFARGGVATFESCWIYPDTFPSMTDSYIEVIGESGVIHLDRKDEQLHVASEAAYEWPRIAIMPKIAGKQQGALTEVVQHFIACVRDDKAPLVTLESSREVTAILDAIHRSIASGKPEKTL